MIVLLTILTILLKIMMKYEYDRIVIVILDDKPEEELR
jgi:hypothetical protein